MHRPFPLYADKAGEYPDDGQWPFEDATRHRIRANRQLLNFAERMLETIKKPVVKEVSKESDSRNSDQADVA